MAGEKKKVNLVNLKTNFGQFLHKWYTCQNCYSIDRLAFGFNCGHRLCAECNDNFRDQCKICKTDIENVDQDNLQVKMFPFIEDLKNIMGIDMKKVSNKLKQKPDVQQQTAKSTNEDAKKVNKNADNKEDKEDKEHEANDEKEDDQNEEKPTERASRRQVKEKSVKKSNESKKNNSSNKKTATKSKSDDDNEDEEMAVDQSKQVKKTRESSRSKSNESKKTLIEIMKESTEKEQPVRAEKSVAKSTRKADKSTKAKAAPKSPPMVIISTSITDAEISSLKKFAKKFNAKVVTDFSDEVTHLVTLEAVPNSNITTRTLKYLKSLLAHKWLLKFDWITSSLENDKLEDESNFELLGITKQTEANLGAPKRSRENASFNLFEGKQFYIDGKFGPKSGLPKNDYRDLVKIGGGELLESEKDVQEDTYIIIDATTMNKSKYKDYKNAVSTNNFLNCVSDFKMF